MFLYAYDILTATLEVMFVFVWGHSLQFWEEVIGRLLQVKQALSAYKIKCTFASFFLYFFSQIGQKEPVQNGAKGLVLKQIKSTAMVNSDHCNVLCICYT